VKYADPTTQLVVEVPVRDLKASLDFYRDLGFDVVRENADFAVLAWEGHQLFLVHQPDLQPLAFGHANVRVMVPDVDRRWEAARVKGLRILVPIDDRDYGLRDFTLADPDGFGVRFGTWLHDL
jgi:catechol 2,3-dioxygenase-like lactoylglutathione lyase family enzyme